MRRGFRRLGYGLAALILLIGVCGLAGFFWLRTSLPQVDGEIAVGRLPGGLGATTTIARDDRGVITIKAASANDAYFAMGFTHAQDRLFQMDAMRRLGAGRLSEVFGAATVDTDKLTRTLELYTQAERQVAEASPGLRQALDAYAAGVNAFLDTRHGALPPEFVLLNYRPESWKPADSLVWGRIMALQLSGNYTEEQLNLRLQKTLKPELFDLLLPAARSAAALPGFYGPLNAASNNWVVGPTRSASGKPMLANDPHLGLGAPSIWYLAHIVTPQMNWLGATSPGMPTLVIGANDHVAWGFTTTQSDTEDLFEEKPVDGKPGQYQTPEGPKAFEVRHEIVKVKGEADVAFDVRSTRHGPVISDLDEKPNPEDPILALAWAALLPGDRTADALYEMNMATSAATFETALMDFHAPQQNVVYVDAAGKIGFVAAGRVPVRRAIYKGSQLPAPGWSGDYDWIGTLPFENLPRDDGAPGHGMGEGWIATANNKTVSSDYPYFITGEWPSDDRFQRIRSMLRAQEKFSMGDFERMQQDILSQPLKDLIQSWLPETGDAEPAIRDMLATWDGRMDRNRAEPLIATLWLDRAARRIFGDELGENFDTWWFWRIDLLKTAIADGKACDDVRTAEVETCSFEIGAAFIDTLKDLRSGYGANVDNWHWGKAHRAHVTHPIFRQIPVLGSLLDADLPTGGDFFTVNRGAAFGRKGALEFPHVHGPTMRLVVDMANPMAAEITLAGGESGNPLSPHYADWLTDWRDGRYRTIVQPAQHMLTLKPQ